MIQLLTSDLGSRITYLRKKQGLQQEELATIIGIKLKCLSDIEKGKGTPRIALLARLAVALKISLEELY